MFLVSYFMIGPVKVGWSSAISSSSSQYSWSRADTCVRTLVAAQVTEAAGAVFTDATVTVTTEKDAEADRVEDEGVADTTALTSLT